MYFVDIHKAHLHEIHFGYGTPKIWHAGQYRRIYTTFVLGTALQNCGTRANRFEHGPLDLHDKICSTSFSVDFSNGTPKTGTALLNL